MTHGHRLAVRRATRTLAPAAFLCVSGALLLLGGCATTSPAPADQRPDQWATPVEAPGVPNLYRVDAGLYRSAQPSRNGFTRLGARHGLVPGDAPITTVLSLRAFFSDAPLVAMPSALRLEQIPVQSWHPEDEDVVQFLRIATDSARQPVLVHCQHGADRTGTMVAIYRIAVQGWTKAAAIDEMTRGGFGFHPIWQNLVRYIEDLDVDAIRTQVVASRPTSETSGPGAGLPSSTARTPAASAPRWRAARLSGLAQASRVTRQ